MSAVGSRHMELMDWMLPTVGLCCSCAADELQPCIQRVLAAVLWIFYNNKWKVGGFFVCLRDCFNQVKITKTPLLCTGTPQTHLTPLHVLHVQLLRYKTGKKGVKRLIRSSISLSVLSPVLLPLSWRNLNTQKKQLALIFTEIHRNSALTSWGSTSSPLPHVSLFHDSARPVRDNSTSGACSPQ